MVRRMRRPLLLLAGLVAGLPSAPAAGRQPPTELATRKYTVTELLPRNPHGIPPRAAEPLIDMIRGCIEPPAWDVRHGRGTIEVSWAGEDVALVVRQTAAVQREVAALLAELERLRKISAAQKDVVPFATPRPDWEEAIRRALEEPCTLNYVETPLVDVIHKLERTHQIKIRLDEATLDKVGIGRDTPVTKQLHGIPLRAALRLMLRELRLSWVFGDGALLVTTAEKAQSQLDLRVYDVRDLAEPPTDLPRQPPAAAAVGISLSRRPESNTLADVITRCIQPSTWNGNGVLYQAGPLKVLVVANTQEVHEEIEALLAELRRVRAAVVAQQGTEIVPVPPARPAWEDAIRKKLEQPVELDLHETPWEDVLQQLQKTYDIPIQVDKKSLYDTGAASGSPKTGKVGGMPLRTFLRRFYGDQELTWVLHEHVLFMTMPEESRKYLKVRVYDVRDLVSPAAPPPRDKSPAVGSLLRLHPWLGAVCLQLGPGYDLPPGPFDQLISLVMALAGTAGEVSGDQGIEPYQTGRMKVLVVAQNDPAHDIIESLLAQARAVRRQEQAGRPAPLVDITPAENVLRRALARPVDWDFKATPLRDALQSVRRTLGVQVYLDKKALDDVGVGTDAPVTLRVSGVSAEAALSMLLKPVGLRWTVDDGLLLVTTPEEEESREILRVYGVRDLLPRGPEPTPMGDYDTLIQLLRSCVEPTTWDEVGGPGSQYAIEADHLHAIAFNHTWRIHREVEEFLGDLAAVRHVGAGPFAPAKVRLLPGEAAVREAIQKRISVDFRDRPLQEAVAALKERLKIEIQIDRRALEDIGVAEDARVTLKADDAPVAAVLDRLLGPKKLTWTFDHKVLLITTREEEACRLFTRVYDVAGLVEGCEERSWKKMTDAIRTIGRGTWSDPGGPGTLEVYSTDDMTALVVVQTWRIHQRIEARLAELRKSAPTAKPAGRLIESGPEGKPGGGAGFF